MKSFILYSLVTILVIVSNYYANCEQLSTVFVLETSDSDSNNNSGEISASSGGSKIVDDSNTKIITDSVTSSNNGKLQQNNHKVQAENKTQTQTQTSRRIEEDKLAAHHQHQNQQQHQKPVRSTTLHHNTQNQTNNPANRPRSHSSTTTTTTTSAYDREESGYNSGGGNSTPKTEERLLISITSEGNDEDEYKPPKKNVVTSSDSLSVGNSELSLPQQAHQHQHQKRKPSITISIQESNLGKQDGSPSAVIVRPSENGQSIVISTVGGGSSSLNNGGGSLISSSGHNKHPQINKPVTSSSIDTPYRDPVESNHHQIHTSTSTYRPALINNDYLNPPANGHRPITSTLVEPSRPIHINQEERPHRPTQSEEGAYSVERPSTARPINRPSSTNLDQSSSSLSGFNNNEQVNNENNRPTIQTETKYPLNEKLCGTVHETRIVGGEEANPDDFLWMAAIIKSKPSDGEARPFCGGSLITRRHILTAAHCLENLAPRDVLVRLGSYDFDDSTASSLSADYAIDQFRVPAQYSKKTHAADIAIMRLKTPLSTNDNYKTVCMPQARRSYVGALGTVTGYGSQSQTFRRAAPKLRQVTVPIWENRKCSVVYKKNLTDSYLCAGYEEGGKDACQGDSGGPLMTEGPNERMMVVGVVSHGIGCGSPGYPGVYTRTTTYLDWIEKNTKE